MTSLIRSLRSLSSRPAVCLLLPIALLGATPAAGQSGDLAARIAGAPDGTVRLAFAARSGVCGEGEHFSTHRGHQRSSDVEWDESCEPGPVRVVLGILDHVPIRIRTYIGGHWRAPMPGAATITDLGLVPARTAADLLLGLARRLPEKPGSDAIFPATLADSTTVWPALGALARNRECPQRTREQAVFWLGQAAADVTAGLDSIAEDADVDEGVREQAVFALSQRPKEEGVPALIQIATSNRDPALRRKALFWLGQSGDARAVDLFERLLTSTR